MFETMKKKVNCFKEPCTMYNLMCVRLEEAPIIVLIQDFLEMTDALH